MKCEGQKPFKVSKSDKLILIIDGSRDDNVVHELIRIDYKEQLRYLSKFLEKFISDKRKIKNIILSCKYNLKSKFKYNNAFSSYRINDRLANIDFLEYQEVGIIYLFMVINYKKKPKIWSTEDFFKN